MFARTSEEIQTYAGVDKYSADDILVWQFRVDPYPTNRDSCTVIEKINATATQRNVLKYFAIFKNVAHNLEPGETPSYPASHQAPNYVQRS